jgi:hypothetical protein
MTHFPPPRGPQSCDPTCSAPIPASSQTGTVNCARHRLPQLPPGGPERPPDWLDVFPGRITAISEIGAPRSR